jgi:hypothetical protein
MLAASVPDERSLPRGDDRKGRGARREHRRECPSHVAFPFALPPKGTHVPRDSLSTDGHSPGQRKLPDAGTTDGPALVPFGSAEYLSGRAPTGGARVAGVTRLGPRGHL